MSAPRPAAAGSAEPGPAPRTVAVLGGSGFLGRAFCARFARAGWRVLAVSRSGPAGGPGEPVRLDLTRTTADELAALLSAEQVTDVVNAAGGMWGLTEEQMFDANVTLVRTLIEAVAAAPGRPRLVQMGSVHEYGLVPIGVSIGEDYPAAPITPYGRLKLDATRAIQAATDRGDVDGLVLRYGNVTGAGQPGHSLLGMIAAQLDAAARKGAVAELTLAPLTALRDFVDLDDCAEAALCALAGPVPEQIVNIGRGSATVTRDLVEALITVSAVPTSVTDSPATAEPETVWQQLAVTRAEELLGWRPQRDLKDSIADLWEAVRAS